MIRVSAGTAAVLGMASVKTDCPPTTAYLMAGEHCAHDCRFCAQARGSSAEAGRLSRVTWPEGEPDVVAAGIARAHAAGKLKRACFQVVHSPGYLAELERNVRDLRAVSPVPICLSTAAAEALDLEHLFAWGADRVSLPLDAASPGVYARVKGGCMERRLAVLREAAGLWPGRIGTHLIAGLGETEEELIRLAADLWSRGVTVALFAFTPLPGTPMAGCPAPGLDSYRRVQAALHLLRVSADGPQLALAAMTFGDGRLTSLGPAAARAALADGEAFRTSGCPDCNRPYYNEKPGAVPYNYARPLSEQELSACLELLAPVLT